MAINLQSSPDKEIRYLRFLNNTLQIRELREDICDRFSRKIFDYLEDKPPFDPQVFCPLIYKFIFKCKLYKSLVMTAEINVYDKIKLDSGKIANELGLFLGTSLVKFTLSYVEPNQFNNISLEEKLGYLLERDIPSVVDCKESKSILAALERKDNPSWKTPRVKIIMPEMSGNTGIVPYFDLEFTLPRLSVEQKLDIIHFAICALNYLSQKDEPKETLSNPEISSTVLVSKPEQLKVVSDNLNRLRDSVILCTIRDKETDDEKLNTLEFDQNAPDIARILKAQNQDREIEKRWANKDLLRDSTPDSEFLREWRLKQARRPIEFTKSDIWEPIKYNSIEENSGTVKAETVVAKEKAKKNKGYPPHFLRQIIDTAVRLYEEKDKVRAVDIYTELHIEKNTYHNRIKYFGYDTSMVLEEARKIVRETSKK